MDSKAHALASIAGEAEWRVMSASMTDDADTLLGLAREAALKAYAPYSNFRVGAAVRAGGTIFVGCNVENASYGLAICAERNAIFQAVAAGHTRIEAVAVSCIDAAVGAGVRSLMPCGACRQVMVEFGAATMPVHIDGVGTLPLDDLLPRAFAL